ncbi:MAG: lipocalin-like domain-containing protein [Pseudomonadota bacterium]
MVPSAVPQRRIRFGLLLVVATSVAALVVLGLLQAPSGGTAVSAPEQTDVVTRLIEDETAHGFEPLAAGWALSLPDDHGGHDDARMETWALSAHLRDKAGNTLGIQISLSRLGVRNLASTEHAGWAFGDLHRAHVVFSDDAAQTAMGEERVGRRGGGHDNAEGQVWLDDWSLSFDPTAARAPISLTASVEGVPLQLTLSPTKPALSAGGGEAGPARGYSLPGLEVTGWIGAGTDRREVTGQGWFDHAWGELPVPGGPVTYDRLLLQLADGTDLTLLRTRRVDGRGVATVDGALIDAAGDVRTLSDDTLTLEAAPASPVNGADGNFVLNWTIRGAGLDLQVEPAFPEQFFAFAQPLWSGLVTVEGMKDGAPISGLGTLQTAAAEQP